jgi:hypothetical protein
MSSRTQVYLVALLLAAVGIGFTIYKVAVLGFPFVPGESRDVWTLESKITFEPTGGPVEVSLALPDPRSDWVVLDEYFASSGFGFSVEEQSGQSRAVWSRREVARSPALYYKLQVYRGVSRGADTAPPKKIDKPVLDNEFEEAAEQLIATVRAQSAEPFSFTRILLQRLSEEEEQRQRDVVALLSSESSSPAAVAIDILGLAGIPARIVRGIVLEDGRRRQTSTTLIEVWDGNQWEQFNPRTGKRGLPKNFFMWQRGGVSLLDVVGGKDSRVEFAILKNTLPARSVVMMENRDQRAALIDFSIYALPVEQQGVFKHLLLIPIGALVVVFLRVVVGIPTSGTFMPILIALAFIQTTLGAGLIIFLLVIGVGLWIRYYLSYLSLLLVARVSAVVIVVVAIMAALSVFSYKLGFNQVLTVTFFPTIILAWTIERMSILWEEEGPKEVFIQGGGSLLVAVITYLVMMLPIVAHLTFNFPELLLVVLGIILVIGQYSGYRLSELYRFRHMKDA